MRVTTLGRLEGFPRRTWERVLAQKGGRRLKQARSADVVIVGAGAAARPEETLAAEVSALRRQGKAIISERAFFRRLGLLPPLGGEPRTLTSKELASRAKVLSERLDLFVLLDIVEGEDGLFGFRALKAAMQAGTLLKGGAALRDVAYACNRMREKLGVAEPLSALALATDADGRLVLRSQGSFAEFDGQLRLGLQGSAASAADLLTEAEDARALGRTAGAIAILRRALAIAPKDLDVLFELGSLLCEEGECEEGTKLLRRATTIRPDFADAWYNIGHAAEREKRPRAARSAYERAVAADPSWPDAHYNLGMLALDDERFGDAIERFEAYLALDPSSEWAGKARKALALARMSLVKRVGT
jgi:tetratricopeptide (TPR) repeat protein